MPDTVFSEKRTDSKKKGLTICGNYIIIHIKIIGQKPQC